ncbi:hypothetical protein BDF22DRAFT_684599 [Syncephalis plumigaleata]|nr:hypothetical protein BDF22DRAFT_684599 [Syncephalis plumigaleata]
MNDITPQYLLVYGLGSMMESREACRQLALCRLLVQHLKLTDKVQGYDPVWSTEDRQLFEESGFQCIEKNESGYRSLDACTLVYMPHCPKGLYANLLAANWHPDRLKHLILLGNCLETYVERLTEAQLRKEFPHALEACKLLNMRYIRLKRTSKEGGHSTSVIEEDRRQFDDNQRAFSELCLQWIDSSLLSKQQHSIEWSTTTTTTTTIMDPELIINE